MRAKPLGQFALQRAIPSQLKAVTGLCLEIRQLLKQHGLAGRAFAVELVVRECLNNAILHGNRRDRRKRVSLELICARKWIHLCISDEGPGFNWRRRFSSHLPKNTSNHGRGMPIISQFAEHARYNRRGNQITLRLGKDSQPRSNKP